MDRKPNVFLVCTGVGHIRRGYESFTEECFAALKNSEHFQLYLLKGGGAKEKQTFRVPCIQRNTLLAKKLAKVFRIDAYGIEQFSFWLAMWPLLLWYRPKVIYYSDFKLGTWLWQLRRFLKFRYQLLFSNGAPNGPPFTRMDHVQQLLPYYYRHSVMAGVSEKKMTLLPYGFQISPTNQLSAIDKQLLRNKKLLPLGKKIILSVGAINKHHKRMDYIINEFAKLNKNNYYLVLLGQFEGETNAVLGEAAKYLENDTYRILSVQPAIVQEYLLVSDFFVLGSLSEGFGRVLVEALAVGLMPIVHDNVVIREVLKDYGIYVDLTTKGALENGIALAENSSKTQEQIKAFAYSQYSWDQLKISYEQMIEQLINEG